MATRAWGALVEIHGGGALLLGPSGVGKSECALELVRRGYTEEQIGMLWSGNLLRVLDEVQEVAAMIQAEEG